MSKAILLPLSGRPSACGTKTNGWYIANGRQCFIGHCGSTLQFQNIDGVTALLLVNCQPGSQLPHQNFSLMHHSIRLDVQQAGNTLHEAVSIQLLVVYL